MSQFGNFSIWGIAFLYSISILEIIFYNIWIYFYHLKIKDRLLSDDHSFITKTLKFTRTIGFVAVGFQFLIFILLLSIKTQEADKDSVFFSAFMLYLISIFLHGPAQFSLERKLRKIEVTHLQQSILVLRGLLTGLLIYVVYFAIIMGLSFFTYTIIKFLYPQFTFPEEHPLIVSLIYIAFGLAGIGLISPFAIRMMLPCKKVTDDEVLRVLKKCFQKANLPEPLFWSIEMDQFKLFNAMVSGMSFGKGIFRQSLFFSNGLLKNLTMAEFEAIMLHEVSHIKLRHIQKRFLFSIAPIAILLFVLTPVQLFVRTNFGPDYFMIAWFAAYLCLMGFQIFFIRRQVRIQEIEADAEAVINLGASLDDFSSTLVKLAKLNHMQVNSKDTESYFNAGAAHPTMDERIMKVKECIERKNQNLPMLSYTEWYRDLFTGKWKYVSFAFMISMITLSFVGYLKLYPAHELHSAVQDGDFAKVKHLIERGRNVNSRDVFNSGATPLIAAVKSNNLGIALYLLDQGANVHADVEGHTSLHSAAKRGFAQISNLLIKRGAKVDAENLYGQTPLMTAAAFGHIDVIDLLLTNHADLNLRDVQGLSPYLAACESGKIEAVEFILKKGVDLNSKNLRGSTCLIFASYYGHTELAKMLIQQKGILLDELDVDGDSALANAKDKGFVALAEVLQKAGSKFEQRQNIGKSAQNQ